MLGLLLFARASCVVTLSHCAYKGHAPLQSGAGDMAGHPRWLSVGVVIGTAPE